MNAAPVSHAHAVATNQSSSSSSGQDDGGFDFFDFLDIINPLQHIPIVSTIYRAVTGDEIGPVARLIGGGVYGLGLLGGGWLSLASTAANVALEEATGNDIAGHAIDLVFGEDGEAVLFGGGGEGTSEEGAAAGDDAVLAAMPRPDAIVVRSTPLNDGAQDPLLGGTALGHDGEGQTAAPSQNPGDLAAATGRDSPESHDGAGVAARHAKRQRRGDRCGLATSAARRGAAGSPARRWAGRHRLQHRRRASSGRGRRHTRASGCNRQPRRPIIRELLVSCGKRRPDVA